jgi:hypothetical protein
MELVLAGAFVLVSAFTILYFAPITTTAQASSSHHNHHPHKTHPPTPPGKHSHKHLQPRGHMLALGDSVMLGCKSALEPALDYRVRVDAAVGRQIKDTITDLNHIRKKHHTLPKTVIIQVGNNGPLLYNDLVALKTALRGVPDIVVVNVRNSTAWENESNDAITQWLRGWHVAHLADWYHHSTNAMLYTDGTHPLPWACHTYARLIATTLRVNNDVG